MNELKEYKQKLIKELNIDAVNDHKAPDKLALIDEIFKNFEKNNRDYENIIKEKNELVNQSESKLNKIIAEKNEVILKLQNQIIDNTNEKLVNGAQNNHMGNNFNDVPVIDLLGKIKKN